MEPIAALNFTDLDSGDEAHASVRASDEGIALSLSLRTDGDIEVVMPPDVGRRLAEALASAADIANLS
jgi:hypothetical protein